MLYFVFCPLVAIVLPPLVGRYLFRRRVARNITTLLSTTMSSVGPQQLAARWDSLPEPVRRYLRFAIADGAPATRTVRLEHGGTFRPKPEQHWLPIRGVEYFTAATPNLLRLGRPSAAPPATARIRLYPFTPSNRGRPSAAAASTARGPVSKPQHLRGHQIPEEELLKVMDVAKTGFSASGTTARSARSQSCWERTREP